MDDNSEKRMGIHETYTTDTQIEELDDSLQRYFEGLEEDMYGVESLEIREQDYTFGAAGSQVDIVYELEELDGETELDIEFTGAEPLVQRFYNEFINTWESGEFLSL